MNLAAIDWLSISINLLLVVFVIDCLLMILLVLMQRPKQEGLGAAFGAGVTDQVFGARTTNVLQRGTVYLATMFFLLSLVLAVLIGHKNKKIKLLAPAITKVEPAKPAKPEKPKEEPAKPKSLSEELPVEVTPPATTPAKDETPAKEGTPAPQPAPADTAPAKEPAKDVAVPPAEPAPAKDPANDPAPPASGSGTSEEKSAQP